MSRIRAFQWVLGGSFVFGLLATLFSAKSTLRSLTIFVALAVTGCGTFAPVDRTTVGREGIVVSDLDGTVIYEFGSIAPSLHQLNCLKVTGGNWGEPRPDWGPYRMRQPDAHTKALAVGATKVRVRTPFGPELLYGVLALCQVAETNGAWVYYGPAMNRHKIDVPRDVYQAAITGRGTYLELYVGENTGFEGMGKYDKVGMALWLSARPLW